eukprot:gnl/MRDRNA2_/MRDRNA2_16977_c0_seq1.p1 gnl/MRDRNA2_/MRDRNA2_16977_c0~~gnl/MRDRNA2_/MRDRNA2_16977_c0_seq1.p1  ORF type:complete len:125 (-),score=0.12 gnl/MRDRNA2_/MRDRNA2_16977_c0_seq1:11-385(-)
MPILCVANICSSASIDLASLSNCVIRFGFKGGSGFWGRSQSQSSCGLAYLFRIFLMLSPPLSQALSESARVLRSFCSSLSCFHSCFQLPHAALPCKSSSNLIIGTHACFHCKLPGDSLVRANGS